MKAIKNKVVIVVGKESTSTSATTGDKLRKAIIAGVKKLTGRTKPFSFQVFTHDVAILSSALTEENSYSGEVLTIKGIKNLPAKKATKQ